MALLEGIFEFVAEVDDAGHVDLEHAVDVSAGAARLDHALSDDFAHLGHRNEVTGNGSGRRGRRSLLTRGGRDGAAQNHG